ncbi:MAG: hypothetical protein L0312_30785, partial [Acidobacteria bacterium]|nr:hypothetical protein [Acidobacteriota bacterium]
GGISSELPHRWGRGVMWKKCRVRWDFQRTLAVNNRTRAGCGAFKKRTHLYEASYYEIKEVKLSFSEELFMPRVRRHDR